MYVCTCIRLYMHGITVTSQWARWRLKSPVSRLFTQPFIKGADQRKHQSSASLAFVRRIHRLPVNSPHEGPVTRKIWWRHHGKYVYVQVISNLHAVCLRGQIRVPLWWFVHIHIMYIFSDILCCALDWIRMDTIASQYTVMHWIIQHAEYGHTQRCNQI